MVNSKGFRNVVVAAMVVVLAASSVWAAEPAKKPRAGGLLVAIPAKTLFCVRINKLDGTLTAANEFLKDVAPESFDAKTKVFSRLGKLLGDERLRGVNKKGNLVIFAVNVPGDSPPQGFMGDLFIGALLPVTKYENFISRNPNCGEPDDKGISTITVDGQTKALVTSFRRFALLCPPGDTDKLIRAKKLMGKRKQSLSTVLDDGEKKLSASSPVWLYLNVKQGSQLVQPFLMGGLEKMKAQLEKAKEKGEGPPIDPSGIIGFYAGIFNMILEGTDNVTVAVAPTAEACNVTVSLKPVPDTTMAAIVGEPLGGDLGNMLGYLDDGAMFNLGAKVDRESLKTTYVGLFELMGQMIPGGMPEADLEQLKELTTKGIDAMGDSVAISFGASSKGSPPFWGKYVFKVNDQEAFEQVLEKELQLMEEGVFAELYKGFGMEMDVEVDRDAGTYKRIKIGGAKVEFEMGDEDAPQAQMLGKMFGDGLDYRWGFVKGNCVYTVGSNADETIRELIDLVRAGGPKRIGSEMKAALAAVPNSRQADAVGTLNYVRMLNMVSGFMAGMMGGSAPEIDDMPSTSNVAFAAQTTADGKAKIRMALPKEHLVEIKSAFEKLIPEIKKQEELQRQKRKEQSENT
ncbi:MAG: hypothetical protein PVJ86_07865 [Phycisphaerales bacterium]|jgi:hypothetical protein